MKICNSCKDGKNEKLFSKNSSKKDGLHGSCKECKSKHQRNWYKGASEVHKKNVKARNARNVEKNIKWVYNYLKTNPCVDCGESDPIVLEFDHKRDKIKNISQLVGGNYSWENTLKEIEKCEVRCSNCHKRKTAKEQNWRILKIQNEDESERDNYLTLNQE